jgi:CRP/FNR family transcriptional regulator
MSGWQQAFPQLHNTGDAVVQQLLDRAALIDLPAGATAFRQGDACHHYLLVVEGSVKVLTRAENGREIVLYRLGSGDSCVLTTSCLFGNVNYPAEGISETGVKALAIPAGEFERALQQSSTFRNFVFGSFSAHVASLITLVEEVAFGRMDIRLARHLLKRAGRVQQLQTTHQQLATELGSAREVISRQLKEFEMQGWVRLHRGSIEIIDRAALENLSQL